MNSSLYEECRFLVIKRDFPTLTEIHGSLTNDSYIVVREGRRVLYRGPNIWYNEYREEYKKREKT